MGQATNQLWPNSEGVMWYQQGWTGDGMEEEEEEEEAKLEGKAGEAGKLRPALLQGPLYLSPLARALRSHGPT